MATLPIIKKAAMTATSVVLGNVNNFLHNMLYEYYLIGFHQDTTSASKSCLHLIQVTITSRRESIQRKICFITLNVNVIFKLTSIDSMLYRNGTVLHPQFDKQLRIILRYALVTYVTGQPDWRNKTSKILYSVTISNMETAKIPVNLQ